MGYRDPFLFLISPELVLGFLEVVAGSHDPSSRADVAVQETTVWLQDPFHAGLQLLVDKG